MHTDSRGYVRAIACGDDELAYLIARGPNPLASICGQVCGAPCELECRRGELDKPIAIRALKRFVCRKFGPESRSNGGQALIEFLKESARRYSPRPCEDTEELLPFLQSLLDDDVPPVEGKSVGIVGSGPAGLAAAHDLALLGCQVSIYEMEPVLAGMLAVGIPEYRLTRDVILAEVRVIEELGVEAITNCQVGKDVFLPELRERHDVVIIAVGAKRSRDLPIPGADAVGVMGGVEFLRDVALNRLGELGQRVVVVGGGNVAYDVGRTVLRQISLDAARTALRESGVVTAHLCCLESLDEMPADDVEIIEGDEEGIIRHNGWAPTEILKDVDGRVTGVTFKKCLRTYDDNHQFAPIFDDSVCETIECDTVIVAIGQSVELDFVDGERDGLEITERGFVACDPDTGATSAADVFISGDLAYGTKLLIHAVASGKKVARSVYEKLTGRAITHRQTELHWAIPDYEREEGYETRPRVRIPTASVADRLRSHAVAVEGLLTETQARAEAGRCLDCGVNTIFDGDKCILCGGCVDVCPQLCLRIISTDRLTGDADLNAFRRGHLGEIPDDRASAILKNELICIRCGLCAERCPVGAITMERFMFKEVPTCQNG